MSYSMMGGPIPESSTLSHSHSVHTKGGILGTLGIYMFPYLLAGGRYVAGTLYEPAMSLRTSVTHLPVPQDVYLYLLVMLVPSVLWLVAEFISLTNREIFVRPLQWDAAIRTVRAVIFMGFGGCFIATDQLKGSSVVPWVGAVIDSLTSGWLGINNAAQEPYPQSARYNVICRC